MLIRPLRETDDRHAISRIYEESWKSAYRGIVPQAYLDSIPTGRWADRIDRPELHSIVLLEGDALIGTSSFCAARMEEYSGYGEIVSLYLLPEYTGGGFGWQLLDAAVRGLSDLGYRDVYLWVLEENHRARRFYEKFGFSDAGIGTNDAIGGKVLHEIQYRYHI